MIENKCKGPYALGRKVAIREPAHVLYLGLAKNQGHFWGLHIEMDRKHWVCILGSSMSVNCYDYGTPTWTLDHEINARKCGLQSGILPCARLPA